MCSPAFSAGSADTSGAQLEGRSAAASLSLFTFFDRNHNGIYDTEDKPLSNISAQLSWPGSEKPLTVLSDADGFSFLPAPALAKDADAASYTLTVLHTDHWHVTTGNTEQSLMLPADNEPGHTAKTVAATESANETETKTEAETETENASDTLTDNPKTVFSPVGLAPNLSIRGRVKVLVVEGIVVTATSPNTEKETISLLPGGDYGFGGEEKPLMPGPWKVRLKDSVSGLYTQLTPTLNYAAVQLGIMALYDQQLKGVPEESKVGYNDLTLAPMDFTELLRPSSSAATTPKRARLPQGYAGFGWKHLTAANPAHILTQRPLQAALADPVVLYNDLGQTATISHDTGFDFTSATLSLVRPATGQQTVEMTAWRGDTVYRTETLVLSSAQAVQFVGTYRNITRLSFAPSGNWQFVIDQLKMAGAKPQ
jgi:hypothetical protein